MESNLKRSSDRFESWKEIAAYLDRTERTARRWEKSEGLPIHRHPHVQRDSVYAFKAELDEWLDGRGKHPEQTSSAATPLSVHWLRLTIAASAAVLTALAGVVWMAVVNGPAPDTLVRTSPLTSYPGEEVGLSFSPDGSQFVFAWKREDSNNFDLYLRLSEGGLPQRRTIDPGDDLSPAWSPDGRWIAFARVLPDLTAAIIVMPAPSGPERQLAVTPISPPNAIWTGAHIAWSPDGKWVVFPDRKRDADERGFTMVSVDSGENRWLLSTPVPARGPAFSRDGRHLAFAGVHSFTASEIYTVILGSGFSVEGAARRITFDKRMSISPVWAPGGDRLWYLSGHYGAEMTVYEIPVVGGPAKAVGSAGDEAALLSPAPLGAGPVRLAFTRFLFDPDILQIELGTPETGQLRRRILISSTRIDFNPRFSPDGNELTFESNRSGSLEIWKCARDGTNLVQLTSFGGPLTTAARWSPDGREIAFNSRADGNADLYVIGAAGGPPRRLTNEPSNEELPNWSRDGRWLYFTSDRSGGGQVWKMPSAGGAAVQLTQLGGFAPTESPDGRFVYFGKGRATGPASLWRVPVSGGEESKVLDSLSDWSTYDISSEGIWFVPGKRNTFCFHSFRTGQTRIVTELAKPAMVGLSISRGVLLLSQVTNSGSDLMMLEASRTGK